MISSISRTWSRRSRFIFPVNQVRYLQAATNNVQEKGLQLNTQSQVIYWWIYTSHHLKQRKGSTGKENIQVCHSRRSELGLLCCGQMQA